MMNSHRQKLMLLLLCLLSVGLRGAQKKSSFVNNAESVISYIPGISWAHNKYLKMPLKHIDDDVKAVNNAIDRLVQRLEKTINDDRRKNENHKFEAGRLEILQDWAEEPLFRLYKDCLNQFNEALQSGNRSDWKINIERAIAEAYNEKRQKEEAHIQKLLEDTCARRRTETYR